MADTRRPTRLVAGIGDLLWSNRKECQNIFLYGYKSCAICERPALRRRCEGCRSRSRRLMSNLRTQAKHSILSDRVHAMLMTMAGRKTLTDAFRLNASDKPKWGRWPPFNFEAFFANLDQQAQRAQQAAETTKIPNGYLVCSQCQQRKLRSHFSKTQLHKPTQKRKCTQCTKPATDGNVSSPRCQQAKIASQVLQSQMDRPSSEKECMQFLPSTTEATGAPYGCISRSHYLVLSLICTSGWCMPLFLAKFARCSRLLWRCCTPRLCQVLRLRFVSTGQPAPHNYYLLRSLSRVDDGCGPIPWRRAE